jgi:translation initiation factor 2B subunit (eIF-2B alpha/beta/delta family)/8-oxo-dGTP pyrophosphatase MutT (NUDIX family)
VVSCLIFPGGGQERPGEDRVLLFKRSSKVRTYQGRLGPIAGSIEARPRPAEHNKSSTSLDGGSGDNSKREAETETPLEAAWRELQEETRLGPEELELWRRGKEFTFVDEDAVSVERVGEVGGRKGRVWTVWPFGFRLRRGLIGGSGGDRAALGGRDESEVQIKMNWEHEGYGWVPIPDVLSGKREEDCVPRLDETLRRLWVEPESVLDKGLRTLQDDHEHGARELGTIAVDILARLVEQQLQKDGEVRVSDVDTWWADLRLQAWHIVANGRLSMGAAIGGAVVKALGSVRRDVLVGGWGVRSKVLDGLKRAVKERKEVTGRVGERFAEVLGGWFDGTAGDGNESGLAAMGYGSTELGSPGGPMTYSQNARRASGDEEGERWVKILTLSSSSTIKGAVLRALEEDPSRHIELRVLESRPLFEGVSMARDILSSISQSMSQPNSASQGPSDLRSRLKIVLASDASVGVLARDVDVVLIGADRISEFGDVTNKTGSLAAVLTAKSVTKGKAVVVCVSELEKIAGPEDIKKHMDEDNDPSEVTDTWGEADNEGPLWKEMVKVRNVYFEWVPAKNVDCYVCETGFLTREDIARYSRRVKELEGEMFEGL